MKRAKKIYAIWSLVMVFTLVGAGLCSLYDLREIGPIVPDTQHQAINSSHAACGEFCWIIIGWVVTQALDAGKSAVNNNSCNGPCGGGGGGGFECAEDDRSCSTMNTW